MGQPINFVGSNAVMRAPEGADNVQTMHVFQTRHSCVSCWELSATELAEVIKTGRVFLSVLLGGHQPPVYVGSESACRAILIDFGPVWPAARTTSQPVAPLPSQQPAPVRYQRRSRTDINGDGWTEVNEDDIPHYQRVGQEIRALYVGPLPGAISSEGARDE